MKKLIALLALVCGPAFAATLGDDGLHDAPWIEETFLDLREDLETANDEGKRLLLMIEQRGCVYCTRMHEEVYVVPEIEAMLSEDFYVVQINMFGDLEVTDFDGTTMAEKDIVRHWGALFTPTLIFYPESVEDGQGGLQAAAVTMPGAFGRWTTQNLMTWVLEEGYLGEESFQKYHARLFENQGKN